MSIYVYTNQIRKDNQDFNNNRIEKAKSEAEPWKIANEALKPKINLVIMIRPK